MKTTVEIDLEYVQNKLQKLYHALDSDGGSTDTYPVEDLQDYFKALKPTDYAIEIKFSNGQISLITNGLDIDDKSRKVLLKSIETIKDDSDE